jgi:hypothetical protein
MAGALASVIAVFPSTDSARWIVARQSYRFFLGALAVWLRTAFAAADGLDAAAASAERAAAAQVRRTPMSPERERKQVCRMIVATAGNLY